MRWVIHTWWRIVCIIFRKLLVGIEKGIISFKDTRTALTGPDWSRAKWINHSCLDEIPSGDRVRVIPIKVLLLFAKNIEQGTRIYLVSCR